MDPRPKIQALKAEIQELEEDIKELKRTNEGLERKNEELEAKNEGLRSRLPEIVDLEEKKYIRDHISANESKIIGNQGIIRANTERITALDTRITEYQRTINATITTTGNIHLRK